MPHTQTYTSVYDGDCTYVAQPTNTANYVGQWTLLTATWDAQIKQMRLYANGIQSGSLATASHTTNGDASGPITIGSFEDLYEYPTWQGDILNPITYPGILDISQLTSLTNCGLPQDPGAVCSS
jgi:hypothetical protein